MKGLRNIDQTLYMNSTLQCLLHVSELTAYFLDEYPQDQKTLLSMNKNVPTQGDISRTFFNLVNGVYDYKDNISGSKLNDNQAKDFYNTKIKKKKKKSTFNFGGFFGWDDDDDDDDSTSNYRNAFSPMEFKRTLGLHNAQFRTFDANDSKDFILYLLQTLHEEMNYFGNKNISLNFNPN